MTKRKTYLILTLLFSLLFIALITLGSYFFSLKTPLDKQFGIASFLFAFGVAFGQIVCLAMYIKHTAIQSQKMKENQNVE